MGISNLLPGSRSQKRQTPTKTPKPQSERGLFDTTVSSSSTAKTSQDVKTVSRQYHGSSGYPDPGRRTPQNLLPPLPFQGPPMASTSHQGGQSQWFQNNTGNPVKTDVELPADPIPDRNGVDTGPYHDASTASSARTPRSSRPSATSSSTSPGKPPHSAGQTSQSPLTGTSVIAARLAVKTSGQPASISSVPLTRQLTNVSATQGPPLRHSWDAPVQGQSQNVPLPRKAEEMKEGGDVKGRPEDAQAQQPGKYENRISGEQTHVVLEASPLRDEIGVNGRQQSPASAQPVPAGPPIGEDGLRATAPDVHDSDPQIPQETSIDKERPADAKHQSQHKGADQEQVSPSGSELSSEELRHAQESTIATVLHEYSTPTIPGVGDAESIHSRESGDGENKLAMVVYKGVDALGSVEAADTGHQPNPMGDLDPDRCGTPATLKGGRVVFQDASNIYGRIEEFLAEHKIPRKAGYDWFTTLLDWTSELKGRRDAELADLGRGNAELRNKLREDAGEKKRLLNEVKLMTDAASRLHQELAQANQRLDNYSRDLSISSQRLRRTEESKHAIEKTLNQCQIKLSATAGQSAVYKDELEKSKKDLEVNREVLHDVRVELETGRRHNDDLNSHIKTLSKDLENERRKHREEITQYSQRIESIEQERRDAEDAAAKERVRLNNAIQSTKRELATLNAAYEGQKVEHVETIQTLQAKHGGQILELRKEHAEIIRMLQLEHDGLARDLKGEHAEEMRRLRSQHSCQTRDLRAEHSRKVEGLELQVAQLKTSRDEDVKRLNGQILQDNKAHREQLDKLQAEGDRRVKTEVEKAMKKQQQRIEALQGTIVGSQDRYYVQISDSSFVQLLESISQQITNLSAGVGRPSTHLFDRSLDPTNYLDQNPHERDRSWTIFVRSLCWSVIIAGFFEFPLGFGCLGSLGEGFERLYYLYLLFSRPASDGTSLEFPGDKATNVWRASFFDAFLKAVKANPNAMQQHESPHTYPGMFKANVDRVVKALTDKLLRLSNRQLDSRVPAQIFKVVYDMGILSLQMGSQRAHVMLEPCESGDLVRAGDRFADEGGLTGVDTTVGLMTQPCMVRIGDGSADTTSEHIIVKGRFISS